MLQLYWAYRLVHQFLDTGSSREYSQFVTSAEENRHERIESIVPLIEIYISLFIDEV